MPVPLHQEQAMPLQKGTVGEEWFSGSESRQLDQPVVHSEQQVVAVKQQIEHSEQQVVHPWLQVVWLERQVAASAAQLLSAVLDFPTEANQLTANSERKKEKSKLNEEQTWQGWGRTFQ